LFDHAARLQAALADRYRLERELGRGGMAIVWLANDLKHDRAVAIKVVRPEIAAALGAERFLREIRITAHLQHPHILTLIDSGEIPATPEAGAGTLYYVMPYAEGETLRERITRVGQLAPGETARILRDVLDALVHAHRMGIVHRDIKPENVMLTERHALVMDFGVAKAASLAAASETGPAGTLTMIGLAVGTPTYMAPEQAAGQTAADPRSDLYAIGVMGYEMLSGQPPFGGTTPQAVLAAHVIQTPTSLGEIRADLPPDLVSTIMRCLEKEPEKRWQSAGELLAQLDAMATPVNGTGATTAARSGRASPAARRWGVGAGALLVPAIAAWFWLGPAQQARDRRWAREQAIPQLLALADKGEWEAAYGLARKTEGILGKDSIFNALRPKFARRVNIRTDPQGASVWRKGYTAPDSTWTLLGRTPLDSLLVSLSVARFRIEAPGKRTLDLVQGGFGFVGNFGYGGDSIPLDADSALPPEMVKVSGGNLDVFYPGFEHVKAVQLGDYLLDRFETTNQQFQRFVDSGGYRRPELWVHPIVKDGRVIPWEQGMAMMVDRTGRPGPSTWEAGEYPTGQENHPVGGISWYEAAAFAKFEGKALPTVAHWNHAASVYNSAWIVPLSNYSGHGSTPVSDGRALSAYGNYGMAGNVREWCVNASGNQRFILGGGWNDEPYQFTDAYTQPPFDRSPTNGVRLARYLAVDSNLTLAGSPLHRAWRDFLKERPVPDPLFAVYLRMYEYDRTPLHAKVVETVDEGDWVRELVRMNAAYASDSLLVYLYLPKRGAKPYPAVVYFPGSNAIRDKPRNLQWRGINFIVKSGRAVLYPVYKGTYQRSDSLLSDVQDTTNFYRDHVIMWAKDLRRGIDYLEARPEISTDRLAYYGVSWGGAMGGLMPAVEPRIKVSLLYVAGLGFEHARPEVDPVNFLPRVKVPTLMLNGRYDFFFPVETSQVPMFRLLGTPAAQKRYVLEDGSHFVARTRLIQEMLGWLDKYQPLPQ
jgi:dienelactone hydrolase